VELTKLQESPQVNIQLQLLQDHSVKLKLHLKQEQQRQEVTQLRSIRVASGPEAKTDAKSNAREAFNKLLQACSNVYNYVDETKDMKGKVNVMTQF